MDDDLGNRYCPVVYLLLGCGPLLRFVASVGNQRKIKRRVGKYPPALKTFTIVIYFLFAIVPIVKRKVYMNVEPEVYNPPPVKFCRSLVEFVVLGVVCSVIMFADWLGRKLANLRQLIHPS